MIEEGRYTQHWSKYAAAIHVLLRNTDSGTQKLQFYKHEFEQGKNKHSINISFSFDLIRGRAVNIVCASTVARDLLYVLDNKNATRLMLKERKIKVSIGKSYQLILEKIQDDTVSEVEEEVSEVNQIEPVVEVN